VPSVKTGIHQTGMNIIVMRVVKWEQSRISLFITVFRQNKTIKYQNIIESCSFFQFNYVDCALNLKNRIK